MKEETIKLRTTINVEMEINKTVLLNPKTAESYREMLFSDFKRAVTAVIKEEMLRDVFNKEIEKLMLSELTK